MHTPIAIAGALLALAASMDLRDAASLERHAQWGDPTKRHATPRPQPTPGSARQQRNDAQRPVQPFGALKK